MSHIFGWTLRPPKLEIQPSPLGRGLLIQFYPGVQPKVWDTLSS